MDPIDPNEAMDPNEPLKPVQSQRESDTKTTPAVGRADLEPPGHPVTDPDSEGMLIGPHNPIFRGHETGEGERPPFVPPGARYDPIDPFGGEGDPDFDEFIPQGGFGDVIRGGRGRIGRGRGSNRGNRGGLQFDPNNPFGKPSNNPGNPSNGPFGPSGPFNPFGGL